MWVLSDFGMGCGYIPRLGARWREFKSQSCPSLTLPLGEGHASLCLGFLICKVGITVTPTSGVLTKMKFNALLCSKHLEQCRGVVSLGNSLLWS